MRGTMSKHIWCHDDFVELVIVGLDNGLAPVSCQAIIWTNTDLLSIEPKGTYLN